jgi:chemotaxis methyl-accepting protein methylase
LSSEAAGATSAIVELLPDEYDDLRALIISKFGIDYPPHRREVLGFRLAGRVAVYGFPSFRAYADHLRRLEHDAAEWGALADAITNSETYFFREPRHFEQAGALLAALDGDAEQPIRILSAGCSSGEEAFSLAMLAASKAPISRRFEVHGVDVTPARLERASSGRYALRSLRRGGRPPAEIRLEQFGSLKDGEWLFHPWLRQRVHFHERNLADPRGLQLGRFDLVFCRNVLIYAHRDQVERFARTLRDALDPAGHLFLGSSESLMDGAGSLCLVRLGDQFSYVRVEETSRPHRR